MSKSVFYENLYLTKCFTAWRVR